LAGFGFPSTAAGLVGETLGGFWSPFGCRDSRLGRRGRTGWSWRCPLMEAELGRPTNGWFTGGPHALPYLYISICCGANLDIPAPIYIHRSPSIYPGGNRPEG